MDPYEKLLETTVVEDLAKVAARKINSVTRQIRPFKQKVKEAVPLKKKGGRCASSGRAGAGMVQAAGGPGNRGADAVVVHAHAVRARPIQTALLLCHLIARHAVPDIRCWAHALLCRRLHGATPFLQVYIAATCPVADAGCEATRCPLFVRWYVPTERAGVRRRE